MIVQHRQSSKIMKNISNHQNRFILILKLTNSALVQYKITNITITMQKNLLKSYGTNK